MRDAVDSTRARKPYSRPTLTLVLRFTTTAARLRPRIMRKGVKSLIGETGILPVPPILSGIRDRI